MKKITRNFKAEEDKINSKHNKEWMIFKQELIKDIQSILIPGKSYDLVSINKIFMVDPGMWKITTLSYDGPISVGNHALNWGHLDIFYLQIVIDIINSKKFII